MKVGAYLAWVGAHAKRLHGYMESTHIGGARLVANGKVGDQRIHEPRHTYSPMGAMREKASPIYIYIYGIGLHADDKNISTRPLPAALGIPAIPRDTSILKECRNERNTETTKQCRIVRNYKRRDAENLH